MPSIDYWNPNRCEMKYRWHQFPCEYLDSIRQETRQLLLPLMNRLEEEIPTQVAQHYDA